MTAAIPDPSLFKCDLCGKYVTIWDVGYMGATDRESRRCDGMMGLDGSFTILCKPCEEKGKLK